MSFESITAFLENFDLTKFVPDLSNLLSSMESLCTFAMLVGPLLLLGFGIWYLFWPRKKVGSRGGFYAYFAMGSKEAWNYTQRMAGLIWTGLGGVLLLVMAIVCITMDGTSDQLMRTAMTCMIWQASLAVLSWGVISALPIIFFTKDGRRRKDAQ